MVTTSTDRRAVDCPHRSSHRHGTRDAYIADHCRCPSCTAANTRWNNQRRRDLAMNRWKPYVDGGAVCEHLLLLRKAGIGIDRIVGRSGVSRSTVQRLLAPASDPGNTRRRVRPDVAERLMAVDAGDAGLDVLVDADATRRRFADLANAGHGVRDIAHRLGRDPASVSRSVRLAAAVTVRTAIAIEQLHYELLTSRRPA
ncbi:MAG TPA: helix-turn-helix domain-containing protein [Nakamurella sp.]